MVEILRNKWCDDLEELLQCPICLNRPKDSVYQCIRGHHICNDCKNRLRTCPTCHDRWSAARNRLAEKLCSKLDEIKLSLLDPEGEINKLLIPNRVSVGLQTDEVISAATAVDEPTGVYPCCIEGCDAKLFFGPLMKHLKIDHSIDILEFPPEVGSVFKHTWPIGYTELMTFHCVFRAATMGTFFMELFSDLFGNLTGYVLMLHNGFISKQFTYQLEIGSFSADSCITYTGEVCSCRTPSTVLSEKSLQASRTEIGRLIGNEKQIKCTVLLGKKPRTEETPQLISSHQQKRNPRYRNDGGGMGRGHLRCESSRSISDFPSESWTSSDHPSESCRPRYRPSETRRSSDRRSESRGTSDGRSEWRGTSDGRSEPRGMTCDWRSEPRGTSDWRSEPPRSSDRSSESWSSVPSWV